MAGEGIWYSSAVFPSFSMERFDGLLSYLKQTKTQYNQWLPKPEHDLSYKASRCGRWHLWKGKWKADI